MVGQIVIMSQSYVLVQLLNGTTFLLENVDTTGMSQTTENLVRIAQDSMVKNVSKYTFKVCGFVTDNAANVQKMRKALSEGVIEEMVPDCTKRTVENWYY